MTLTIISIILSIVLFFISLSISILLFIIRPIFDELTKISRSYNNFFEDEFHHPLSFDYKNGGKITNIYQKITITNHNFDRPLEKIEYIDKLKLGLFYSEEERKSSKIIEDLNTIRRRLELEIVWLKYDEESNEILKRYKSIDFEIKKLQYTASKKDRNLAYNEIDEIYNKKKEDEFFILNNDCRFTGLISDCEGNIKHSERKFEFEFKRLTRIDVLFDKYPKLKLFWLFMVYPNSKYFD